MIGIRQIFCPGLIKCDDVRGAGIETLNFVNYGDHQPQSLLFVQLDGSFEIHPSRAVPDMHLATIPFDNRTYVSRDTGLQLIEIIGPDVEPIWSMVFVELKEWPADDTQSLISASFQLLI